MKKTLFGFYTKMLKKEKIKKYEQKVLTYDYKGAIMQLYYDRRRK